MPDVTRLILASGSPARRSLLEAAGLIFDVRPADIDEASIRNAIVESTDGVEGADVADALAAEKARRISTEYPRSLVLGADQVLTLGGKIFSKAENLGEAREILSMLRGRTHELVSSIALARNGQVYWQTSATAEMTMRSFSDEFLGCYLEKMGERVLKIVGCYEIEGLGVQLFEEIDGDHFTILGIPLLELLAQLRHEGMLTA